MLLILLLFSSMVCGAQVTFREHPIADDLKGAYQVVAADVNRDGRVDLIGLGQFTSELYWFENPGWERHLIAKGLSGPINLDFWDPGVGAPQMMVLAAGFSMEPSKSVGTVYALEAGADAREPWRMREIDRLPTSHRIRFARLEGSGGKVAVNAPLANAASRSPEYAEKVPLVFYRPGVWKREVLLDGFDGVLHGIAVVDWDGEGRDEILASFDGVERLAPGGDGRWTRSLIGKGNPNPRPKGGSSDVAVGRLGKARFICAIEPWHGNEVVVYNERGRGWERTVIDDTLDGGHALAAADFDGDGRDEIVAGYRGKGGRTYLYAAGDATGARWTRRLLDEKMPAASCAVADLNGDGRPDLACTGASGLKWYENLGAGR
jgi:hypothetical protein